MTTRADQALVSRGLARSRGHARQLIEDGLVRRGERVLTKPSTPVADGEELIVDSPGPNWVGRAAYKLVGALETYGPLGLTVTGQRCIDVGASTGGFTQVLLAHGAAHVVALDVGHNQLAELVRADDRVTDRSGVSVRGVDASEVGGPFDVLVADLSFISLTLVMPDVRALVHKDAELLLLVKPQFEVGRERLGKNGIVRASGDRAYAITQVVTAARENGLYVRGLAPSPIAGTTGNAEYLCWLSPRGADAMTWDDVIRAIDEVTSPEL